MELGPGQAKIPHREKHEDPKKLKHNPKFKRIPIRALGGVMQVDHEGIWGHQCGVNYS